MGHKSRQIVIENWMGTNFISHIWSKSERKKTKKGRKREREKESELESKARVYVLEREGRNKYGIK